MLIVEEMLRRAYVPMLIVEEWEALSLPDVTSNWILIGCMEILFLILSATILGLG